MTLITNLPADVLLYTFGFLPTTSSMIPLAAVCSGFRELLLASPILWSTVSLGNESDLDIATLFFERSGTCPLNLTISSPLFDHIAANIAAFYPARWRTLSLRALIDIDITHFLRSITLPPQLIRLQILASEREYCATHAPIFHSPGLRALAIHGCIACLPPIQTLTSAHIYRMQATYHDFRTLIQGLPNLHTLVLEQLIDPFDDEIEVTYPSFEAASIRSLAVSFVNDYLVSSNEKPLLTSLYTPNIQYLEISGNRRDYGEFSGKQYPFLQTLSLRDMDFSSPSDCAVYHSLHRISRIELHHTRGLDVLFGNASWPTLETLVYEPPLAEEPLLFPGLRETRPNLTILVPKRHQSSVKVNEHSVQFYTEGPVGLLDPELFAQAQWNDLANNADYSDDSFDDFDLDFEDDAYDYEQDYYEYEDDDDGEDADEWY